jgi:hypothetical protein
VRDVAGAGERYNQPGAHPDGYLIYGADGRMMAFFASDQQPHPRAEPDDAKRIARILTSVRAQAKAP